MRYRYLPVALIVVFLTTLISVKPAHGQTPANTGTKPATEEKKKEEKKDDKKAKPANSNGGGASTGGSVEKKETKPATADKKKETKDQPKPAETKKKEEPKKEEPKKEVKPAETKPADNPSARTSSGTTAGRYKLPYKTWSLTLQGGITHPYTDIHYRRFLGVIEPKNENQWYAGINSVYMFDPAFGVKADFMYAKLQGVIDSNMDSRNDWNTMKLAGLDPSGVYFNASAMQGSVSLYWNITNTMFGINRYIRSQNKNVPSRSRKVSLYTYVGVGMNYSKTTVRSLLTEVKDTSGLFFNGSDYNFVVPVGFGVKFKVTKAIDIGLDVAYHFTFTDNLDGFTFQHPNKRRDDFFSTMGLTLTYKIGTKKRDKEHIEWRNPTEGIYDELATLNRRVDKLYKDGDGDGVSDVFDKDNETPEGAKVYGDGTEVDTDKDGVPDVADLEPFTDPGAKVDQTGKAIDTDGDGVPDIRDLEPNTPKGDLTNFQGVSLDNKYASKAAMDSFNNAQRGSMWLPSIYFDFDKNTIQRQYEDELQTIAQVLRDNKGMKLLVIGYCDEKGTDPYNDDLGIRRAKQVVDYMVRVYGIELGRFEIESRGERETEKDARDNINRRVDFKAK
jgi:outer membrane protein OmpA-like peptidoglycan-associated protein/outer membrane protein W